MKLSNWTGKWPVLAYKKLRHGTECLILINKDLVVLDSDLFPTLGNICRTAPEWEVIDWMD